MYYLFQILVPIDVRPQKARRSQGALRKIEQELAARFGGVTSYVQSPATGLWKQSKVITRDRLVVVEVMSNKKDVAWWRHYRLELEDRLQQERVVIRFLIIEKV